MPSLDPEQRSAQARRAVQVRWENDTEGIDKYIDKLTRRAAALTIEQRARLRLLADAAAVYDYSGDAGCGRLEP